MECGWVLIKMSGPGFYGWILSKWNYETSFMSHISAQVEKTEKKKQNKTETHSRVEFSCTNAGETAASLTDDRVWVNQSRRRVD